MLQRAVLGTAPVALVVVGGGRDVAVAAAVPFERRVLRVAVAVTLVGLVVGGGGPAATVTLSVDGLLATAIVVAFVTLLRGRGGGSSCGGQGGLSHAARGRPSQPPTLKGGSVGGRLRCLCCRRSCAPFRNRAHAEQSQHSWPRGGIWPRGR